MMPFSLAALRIRERKRPVPMSAPGEQHDDGDDGRQRDQRQHPDQARGHRDLDGRGLGDGDPASSLPWSLDRLPEQPLAPEGDSGDLAISRAR